MSETATRYAVTMFEDTSASGRWWVEAIDHGSEGEVYRTMFEGHKSEREAEAFAMHRFGDATRGEPGRKRHRPTLTLVPNPPDTEERDG